MPLRADPQSTDVFIAGGGPAGLAAAIAAAQRGFSVMVADISRPPIDKACGEGIMPDGVQALGELGLNVNDIPAARLEGIRFIDEEARAGEVSGPASEMQACWGSLCARFPQGTGLGVRRTALQAALAARAERVGVRLAWGTRVESVGQGVAVAGGSTIRCRYTVCADGLHSGLRQMAGLGPGKARRRRYGFRSHYRVPPWSQFVEVYWADCGQIYVTPVGAGEICVALLTSDPHARLERALPAFPALREKLRRAASSPMVAQVPRRGLCGANLGGQDTPADSGLAGFHGGASDDCDERRMGGITATRRLQAVVRGRIALLGDASGSADAITGDGLSLAFQQALALAEALARDDLARYQRAHESISRLPRAMGELLLLLDGHRRLRRRVFAVFGQSPEIFDRLLAVHTRGISPLELGMRDYLRFGWKLLSA